MLTLPNLRLKPELQTKISAIAKAHNMSADEYISELVEREISSYVRNLIRRDIAIYYPEIDKEDETLTD